MCIVDDGVKATPNIDDHIDRLDEVFKKWRQDGIKCKPSECDILKGEVVYYGRLINEEGVEPDPESIRVVLKWEVPRNKRELQSFLGFANYNREFIKDYEVVAVPIQHLVRTRGTVREWTSRCQRAFGYLCLRRMVVFIWMLMPLK